VYSKQGKLSFKTVLDTGVSREAMPAFKTSVASSAGLADDVMSACLAYQLSWSKTRNGSDRVSCMQQQHADCLAAVFYGNFEQL